MGADSGQTGMSLTLHDAAKTDEAAFRRLWAGYLAYYTLDLAPEVTTLTWARILTEDSPMGLRLAWSQGVAVGFALYQNHPSSWVAGDDCYLEDLYVMEPMRGQGIGRALIEDLKRLARARGWHRLYWLTAQDNTAARALYDTLSANDNHIRYRTEV
jgi:GNAT superfamily N-acetyltransferase